MYRIWRGTKHNDSKKLEEVLQPKLQLHTDLSGLALPAEFNSRGDSLMELESQLHHSADIHIQMQDRLNKFEECNLKIKRVRQLIWGFERFYYCSSFHSLVLHFVY